MEGEGEEGEQKGGGEGKGGGEEGEAVVTVSVEKRLVCHCEGPRQGHVARRYMEEQLRFVPNTRWCCTHFNKCKGRAIFLTGGATMGSKSLTEVAEQEQINVVLVSHLIGGTNILWDV